MSPTPASLTSRTAAELRRAFLDFFTARGHTEVPSAPLVPNDPTLLFTTAGMVQFKPYYTAADVPYTRAVSVQKCLRLSDLEYVGLTPRHDTFFEMLGNFSFGPREKGAYFKAEAIDFAWEFVTETLGMPKSRLYASVFAGEGKLPRDDEAVALWKKIGLPADHIVALGRADNFWGPAGGSGPCGPCSEIYFDLGEKRPDYLAEGAFWGERPGDPGDRYMEFWNLVFPQFDAQTDGTLRPLPRPGIDTGMGIERLALIVQGKSTIFETDLFAPLVEQVLGMAEAKENSSKAVLADARIIADHVRALVFSLAERVVPGNEGAGYVLRRLLRRAVSRARSAEKLDIQRPILSALGDHASRLFQSFYPELVSERDFICEVLEREEAHFAQTYEAGLAKLQHLIRQGARRISGQDAFTLHDTYGFPIELTEEIARVANVTVDRPGFEHAMGEQRERARSASKFGIEVAEESEFGPWQPAHEAVNEPSNVSTEFVGYEVLAVENARLHLWREREPDQYELILDRTPCYAESGGQASDRAQIMSRQTVADVERVYRFVRMGHELTIHRVRLTAGSWLDMKREGGAGRITVRVDRPIREATMRHHTATHLLQATLRRVLGHHVRQAGSLVVPSHLRFDYTHFEQPKGDQLIRIEEAITEWIIANREVSWRVLPLEEAKQRGAMALFGEKYGAMVRMVAVDGVPEAGIEPSLELCGGTHVSRTGDIGEFLLLTEEGIASGVRRIEAYCGKEALKLRRQMRETLARSAIQLQVNPLHPTALPEQIDRQKKEIEYLKAELVRLASQGLESELDRLIDSAEVGQNARWFVAEVSSPANAETLRGAADRTRAVLGRGAFLVASRSGGRLTFMASVSDDLVKEGKLRADELVRAVAKLTGGSGGGKPHLALAGGKDPTMLGAALSQARQLLKGALGS